ncbi:MAG: radical SAM family heme chaperone HemW [Lachnospiraceae bacterium]|nr:radical SAM family heme chaperone HemW [Lachnospiraceae bacterium]
MEARKLGLYLHIPFCVRKCNYCDFLSAPSDEESRSVYVNALCHQIREAGAKMKSSYAVDTIFFGGGTPSILTGEQLAQILGEMKASFLVAEDAEITIECNPGTADCRKLKQLRQAGFNRLSIGLQTADNDQLKLLGRIHTWEQFCRIWEEAAEAGFTNCSVDLISALPGQTVESLRQTLNQVLTLTPPPAHLSAYSLIVEEGTPFFERYGDGNGLPDEEETLAMDRLIWSVMEEWGYERYEISNYAKPGCASRHNRKYWDCDEYLGLGLGASSYLRSDCGLCQSVQGTETEATENAAVSLQNREKEDSRYVRLKCRSGLTAYWNQKEVGSWWEEILPVTKKEEMEEYMFLGLRKTEGIAADAFEQRFGCPPEEIYGTVMDKYIGLGLMVWERNRLFLTQAGMEVSNQIMADFLLDS